MALLRLLRKTRSHPTAAELHRGLLTQHPNVSLKTVYDILDSLVAANLAACVTDGGEPYRYEAQNAPHYHARCRACGSGYHAKTPAKSSGEHLFKRHKNADPDGNSYRMPHIPVDVL